MKNSMAKVNEVKEQLRKMRAELAEAYKQNEQERLAVYEEMCDIIKANSDENHPLSAHEVASLCDNEVAWQSVAMCGYTSDAARSVSSCKWIFNPSAPRLRRKRVTKTTHYVAFDPKTGEIDPNNMVKKETEHYEYFVK